MTFTDATIERYLAGELSADAAASLEKAAASDAMLKARVEALRSERNAFFAADPPAAFAHRLMTRLEVENEASVKPPWWRSLLVPVFATSAVLVIGVAALVTNSNQSLSPQAAHIDLQHEDELVDARPPPAAVVAEQAPAAQVQEPEAPAHAADKAAPARAEQPRTEAKKAKSKESIMDPRDNRVSDALSKKDADDSASGSGLGIGSARGERREYAKPPDAVAAKVAAKEEAPAVKAEPFGDAKERTRDVAPSAVATAAPAPEPAKKPMAGKGAGGTYGYAEISVDTHVQNADVEAGATITVPTKSGSARATLSGQTIKVPLGQTVRVAANWPATHVALIIIGANGKLSTLYQGNGQTMGATVKVEGPLTLVLLRSSQPIRLDVLRDQAAKLQEKAMSLTFIPSQVEKRFVRLQIED